MARASEDCVSPSQKDSQSNLPIDAGVAVGCIVWDGTRREGPWFKSTQAH